MPALVSIFGNASGAAANRVAMETWKEIKFEFDTVDKIDVARK